MDFPTPKAGIALANDPEGMLNFLQGQLLHLLALIVFPLTKIRLAILFFYILSKKQRLASGNWVNPALDAREYCLAGLLTKGTPVSLMRMHQNFHL